MDVRPYLGWLFGAGWHPLLVGKEVYQTEVGEPLVLGCGDMPVGGLVLSIAVEPTN